VRQAQGLTLRQVADRSGVDFAYLARIERGEATGSITTLRKITRALGMGNLADTLALYDPEAE
jgi:transcriptional regulator with XRE-family HTH domain